MGASAPPPRGNGGGRVKPQRYHVQFGGSGMRERWAVGTGFGPAGPGKNMLASWAQA